MNVNPTRASIYGFGVVGITGFVFQMLAVDYPEGDPAKAREAAAVWARLAERIEQSPDETFPAAQSVWKKNAGDGVDGFKSAVTAGLYTQPPEAAYTARLAHRCRQNSEACTAFADLIEAARHAYWTLALANLASFLYITTFPWQAGTAYQITQFLMRRAQAGMLAKLLEHNIARIVLSKLTEYTIGSAFFAVGDVSVVAGVKALRGDDVGTFRDNATQAFKEFAASVAFYGVFDAAAPLTAKATKNLDVQYFLNRLAGGSLGYGPTYDLLNGQEGAELVPTAKETLGRVLLYFTMAHKPAG
ncbi:WXG100-like domain-containing protein [Nonomuraea sp. LPB2021202275-12-8]|uniref:WXG100-like domain-containing protein n=1 Tax=Nonomuraea sp. LPB2021202275-12-8 TaxID=3120159 RepID=UPI00300CCA76